MSFERECLISTVKKNFITSNLAKYLVNLHKLHCVQVFDKDYEFSTFAHTMQLF